VLGEKYRLVRLIGRGGMGLVYEAEHLSLGSAVAIKLIAPDLVCHPEGHQYFQREARAAAALRSPHVVQVFDHGVDDGVPYIVMELLEGESLAERLVLLRKLAPGDTARIMSDVGRGIGQAHEMGIVHCDLKPDNVFLARSG